MIRTLLNLSLSIGLILPTISGSEFIEHAVAEQSLGSSRFIEKGKELTTNILEHDLLHCMGRHDRLTERNGQIDTVLKLFSDYLNQSQLPCEGYDIILEDIQAHPDPEEQLRQLSQMNELLCLVASRTFSPSTLVKIRKKLDQRKEVVLSVRRNVIEQTLTNAQMAKKLNTDLLAQTKSTFEAALALLGKYKGEEAASRWTLESSLPPTSTEASSSATETILPILADAVKDYKELTETVKSEELAYLKATLVLLADNRNKTLELHEEANLLQDLQLGEESKATLEKYIANIDMRISLAQEKMKKL